MEENLRGEGGTEALRVTFDTGVKLEFHGAKVTSDAGLLAYRERDDARGLFAPADNLGNFLRRLALPRPMTRWTMTTLREKPITIGARVVEHARYVVFPMAAVAVSRSWFATIRERIRRLPGTAAGGWVPSG